MLRTPISAKVASRALVGALAVIAVSACEKAEGCHVKESPDTCVDAGGTCTSGCSSNEHLDEWRHCSDENGIGRVCCMPGAPPPSPFSCADLEGICRPCSGTGVKKREYGGCRSGSDCCFEPNCNPGCPFDRARGQCVCADAGSPHADASGDAEDDANDDASVDAMLD